MDKENTKDKGLVITTEETMYIKEFDLPLYQSVGDVVGGYIEKVSPQGLKEPFCFLCNEEGLLKNLPINVMGSLWYGTLDHGQPIVGNIVVMKLGYRDGEPDIIGLEDSEIDEIKSMVNVVSSGHVREVNADANLS